MNLAETTPVRSGLERPPHDAERPPRDGLLIGGAWQDAAIGRMLAVHAPAIGQLPAALEEMSTLNKVVHQHG
ncbi:MAG: hypothetical protein ACKVQR_17645 [Aquabacterium sp.]